jgi:TfoX/Sxy family transcriptional regulator of competence genes
MATALDFVEYVCDQISDVGFVRYKKMFGEYMVYVNDKPILLICNNTVYVKMLSCLAGILLDAEKGIPYNGAKEYYILDADHADLLKAVIEICEPVTPLPKPRKKKRQI